MLANFDGNDLGPQDFGMPQVSVVIPAFNAGRWIARTLRSVQRQTLSQIEIIVVDDGSTDDTVAIVAEAAFIDLRIRLIRQPNGGVARARNAGIAAARSDYVAPIDADDLWHPTRLEHHLQALSAAGKDTALAYSPFVRIDDEDNVRFGQYFMPIDGNVFERHLCENFIGNGSGITIRTAVAREIGGYSPDLRDATAEGFEDWLFQLKAAHKYKFVCVPLYLVGYRTSSGAMSSDLLRMARSGVLAMREIERCAPDVARPLFWWPQARACGQFAIHLAKKQSWRAAAAEIGREMRRNPVLPFYLPVLAVTRILHRARSMLKEMLPHRQKSLMPFDELDPNAVHPRGPTVSAAFWLWLYKRSGERRIAAAVPIRSSFAFGQELEAGGNKIDAVK